MVYSAKEPGRSNRPSIRVLSFPHFSPKNVKRYSRISLFGFITAVMQEIVISWKLGKLAVSQCCHFKDVTTLIWRVGWVCVCWCYNIIVQNCRLSAQLHNDTQRKYVCACVGIDYGHLLMRLRKVHNGISLVVTCVTLLLLWRVIFSEISSGLSNVNCLQVEDIDLSKIFNTKGSVSKIIFWLVLIFI